MNSRSSEKRKPEITPRTSRRLIQWGLWSVGLVIIIVLLVVNTKILNCCSRINQSITIHETAVQKKQQLLQKLSASRASEVNNKKLHGEIFKAFTFDRLPELDTPFVIVTTLKTDRVNQRTFWMPKGKSELKLKLWMERPQRSDPEEMIVMRRSWTLPIPEESWTTIDFTSSKAGDREVEAKLTISNSRQEFSPVNYVLPREFIGSGAVYEDWNYSRYFPNQTGDYWRDVTGIRQLNSDFLRTYPVLNPITRAFVKGTSSGEKVTMLLEANVNFEGPKSITAHEAKLTIANDPRVRRASNGRYFLDADAPAVGELNLAGQTITRTTEGGRNIDFHIYYPARYTANSKLPLLIFLGPDCDGEKIFSEFRDMADARNWIVVSCNRFEDVSEENLAADLFAQLLASIDAEVEHDDSELYIGGLAGGSARAYQYSAEFDRPWKGIIACNGYINDHNPQFNLSHPKDMVFAIVSASNNKQANNLIERDQKLFESNGTKVKRFKFDGPKLVPPSETLAEAAEWIVEGDYTPKIVKKKPLPKVGEYPPEIFAEQWINADGPLTLKSLRGKVVLVDFISMESPPTVFNISWLNELQKEFANQGLVILGFSDEAGNGREKFLGKRLQYIGGTGSTMAIEYGVMRLPHSFLIGQDGKLVWQGVTSKKNIRRHLLPLMVGQANDETLTTGSP